jgi:amino acid permease
MQCISVFIGLLIYFRNDNGLKYPPYLILGSIMILVFSVIAFFLAKRKKWTIDVSALILFLLPNLMNLHALFIDG